MKDSEFHDDGKQYEPMPLWIANILIPIALMGLIISLVHLCKFPSQSDAKEWATYQKGAMAQQVGAPANANPYADAKHRNLWLDGWLHAANVVDRAGGQQ
jgi:ribosome modulation factor